MAKNEKNLIRFDLDPAVEAVINGREKKRSEAHMPRSARKKIQRERAKAEKRAARRFGVDVDEDLIDAIKELAEKNSCPASQLVQLAMQLLKDAMESGTLDIRDYRVPADGPRYEYRVERYKVSENDK